MSTLTPPDRPTPMPTPAPAPMPAREQAQGLICPNCSGVVPIAEGVRIVQCPYCNLHLSLIHI